MTTPSFEYFYDIMWYIDSKGKKISYLRYNIPFQVVGGKVELGEIPDSIYKIRINNMTEIHLNGLIKSTTTFKCNYNTGTVYFDGTQEGKFFNITFNAKGKIKYYSKNMIVEDKNNVFANNNAEDVFYEIYQRINNLITSNPQPNEVQDARLDGATNINYATLGTRLNYYGTEIKNAKTDIIRGITYNTIQDRLNKYSENIGDMTQIGESNLIENIKQSPKLGYSQSNLTNWKDRFKGIFVDVRDFGAKCDGVTDDTVALQNAFNASGDSIKIIGRILIKDSIIIDNKKNIIGDTSLSSGVSEIIMDSSVKKPIFISSPTAYCGHTIRNINFSGYSGIDARSGAKNVIKYVNIFECGFYSSVFGGIGIQLMNHDFSKIRDCHFQGEFYCGIRVAGWLDDIYTNNKNTTQAKMEGCSFILDNQLTSSAISFEQIDSCHIKDCDFACSTISTIDIGGKIFNLHIPVGEKYYIPNQSNKTEYVGSCTYSNIKDNHFENFNVGIYIDGAGKESCHGITIFDNNFQTFRENSKAIYSASSVFGLHTNSNYMDMGNISSAMGIVLDDGTWNAFLENDFITGKGTYYSGNAINNSSNTIWKRKTSGKLRNEADFASMKFPNIKADSLATDNIIQVNSIKTNLNSIGSLTNNKADIFEPISIYFKTSIGETKNIYTFENGISTAVGILILTEYSSMGNLSCICAFNDGTVTKISGNGFTPSTYELAFNNTNITYKQLWNGGDCDHYLVGSIMYISR